MRTYRLLPVGFFVPLINLINITMNFKSFIISSFCLSFMMTPIAAEERIILINEGNWQSDNGRLSYFEGDAIVSNQWFRDVNGRKLGDTPNDIIQVREDLIAIAINWSNIIQFIDATGHAVGETEDVPNNRCLATDGEYLYVTSYGHECMTRTGQVEFEKGFVAKIDTHDFQVDAAVEVGWEPEGIAIYDGRLFVANSGGYGPMEGHDYGQTISVIDAETMEVVRTVDTGQINLCGDMTLSDMYICVSSPGDYYEVGPATIIMDCAKALSEAADEECLVRLDCNAAISTATREGKILAIGSTYSYLEGGYTTDYLTIDPELVMRTEGAEGCESTLPGNMVADISNKISMPYGLYVNPYTGYIYATDAGTYTANGKLFRWTPEGTFIGSNNVYINPSRMVALDPNSSVEIVEESKEPSGIIYNLQGIPVSSPRKGEIYIRGKKKIRF